MENLRPKFAAGAVLLLLISTIYASPNKAQDALAKMQNEWSVIECYTVMMEYRQIKGHKSEERTVEFSFKRPGWILTKVLKGKDKGSFALYNPLKDKVYARRPWMPVALEFSPAAHLVTTLRGDKIYEASFENMLLRAKEYQKKGRLKYLKNDILNGHSCVVVEFTLAFPLENRELTKELWWLDESTHFPVRVEGYNSTTKQLFWLNFKHLELNSSFPADYFQI